MDDGIHLPTAAGCLLALAGAMHLAVGVEAFLADGTTLSALLVLWGVVALGGVAATAAGLLPRRPARLGAIALLALSLLGYVDVYALGLSESALGVEWQPPDGGHDGDHGHGHGWDGDPEQSLLGRLASGHFALPSKVVELAALALLVVLVGRE